MDIGALLKGALPSFATNMTDADGLNNNSKITDDVMKSLMPLFGAQFNPLLRMFVLLYNMAGSHLGIDPTLILTAFGFFWAANKLWRQLYGTVGRLIQDHLTSNVHINSTDDIYLHVMRWLAAQPHMTNSRSLAAETTSKTAWEDEDDLTHLSTTRISADGSGIYLNFSNQEAKSPPRFIPAHGAHGFWFEGRWFRLLRKQEALWDDGASSHMPQLKDKENLVLSCYGRSPEPIKRLLKHAKEQYYHDHHAKTIIKRPAPQAVRRFGSRYNWMQVANRPVRPMGTVVLDARQKVQVLRDMNEYLHPSTPRWYASRGVPLRRGYLFHGPPGTGKTSLSFALAGVFGLDIYVISLLEPSLTEEDLSNLFNSLPRRCVVLLEDIDTAGLSRPVEEEDDKADEKDKKAEGEGKKKSEDGKKEGKDAAKDGSSASTDNDKKKSESKAEGSKEDWKVSDLARELKKQGEAPTEKKGISLSGLLNAIDGVASHEGRVLIMTTNKPESLDEALIRPGRVDLQVAFTNATSEQARELFERMYDGDVQETKEQPTPADVALLAERAKMRAEAKAKANAVASDGMVSKTTKTSVKGHSRHGSTSSSSSFSSSDEDDESTVSGKSSPVSSTASSPVKLTHEDAMISTAAPSATTKSTEPESKTELQQPQPQPQPIPALFDDNEHRQEEPLTAAGLIELARDFAAKIPDGQFSPAEIQGFLLKRKRLPRRAMAEIDAWVAGMLQQKASKTKVLQVQ